MEGTTTITNVDRLSRVQIDASLATNVVIDVLGVYA